MGLVASISVLLNYSENWGRLGGFRRRIIYSCVITLANLTTDKYEYLHSSSYRVICYINEVIDPLDAERHLSVLYLLHHIITFAYGVFLAAKTDTKTFHTHMALNFCIVTMVLIVTYLEVFIQIIQDSSCNPLMSLVHAKHVITTVNQWVCEDPLIMLAFEIVELCGVMCVNMRWIVPRLNYG